MKQLSEYINQVWEQKIRTKLSPFLSFVWLGGITTALIAAWGFIQIADEVIERESYLIDVGLLQAIKPLHTPLLNQIMIRVTHLGNVPVLMGLSLGFIILWFKQRKWAETITMTVAALGSLGLNFLLKTLFSRPRPELWERIVEINSYSFPSGHAMISLSIYGFIAYLLILHYRRWQILIISLTGMLVILIGFSRLYLGVHWPTDIAAGYAAGLVWLITCILSLKVLKRKK